jgi:hypothetical protein
MNQKWRTEPVRGPNASLSRNAFSQPYASVSSVAAEMKTMLGTAMRAIVAAMCRTRSRRGAVVRWKRAKL